MCDLADLAEPKTVNISLSLVFVREAMLLPTKNEVSEDLTRRLARGPANFTHKTARGAKGHPLRSRRAPRVWTRWLTILPIADSGYGSQCFGIRPLSLLMGRTVVGSACIRHAALS